MTRLWKQASPAVCACLASLLMILSASCSSHSSSMAGLPTDLPNIHLAGTTNTPPHSMASYEYPFDSNGRYVSDWAAEGERRAGRSASATRADSSRWSSSHSSSSGKRKVASSSGGSSKSKSSSGSKSKSSGGRSYTVKKGDTLSHIASRHGTSVKKIMAANGMSSDFLKIGRVLRIP
jgi:LysM repeat protein